MKQHVLAIKNLFAENDVEVFLHKKLDRFLSVDGGEVPISWDVKGYGVNVNMNYTS